MKWILAYFIQRFARDPEARDRALSALDGLRSRFGQQGFGPSDGSREERTQWGAAHRTIEADGRDMRTSSRAGTLIWSVGGGVLVLWGLLAAAAYGLWSISGDWLIRVGTGVGRASNLPVDVAEPLTSLLYLVRDAGGPVVGIVGVVVGIVILVVTAVAARVAGHAVRR